MLDNENLIRTGTFITMVCVMLLLEALFPRKTRTQPRQGRWLTNLGIVVLDSIALRLLVPLLAIEVADQMAARHWGLFNQLDWPMWLEIIICVLLLDMLIYWQHVLSHRIPILWKFHQVHHADRDIDATTGVRFHPVEIVLSMIYKIFWVVVLGPAAMAVFLFEVILNACAVFNHANLSLPRPLDAVLRVFIVTPDMHRVHHSVIPDETNSNYGFNISLWDRIFRSYKPQPDAGHDAMTIGLTQYQDSKPSSLLWCLQLPFVKVRRRSGE